MLLKLRLKVPYIHLTQMFYQAQTESTIRSPDMLYSSQAQTESTIHTPDIDVLPGFQYCM